MTNLLKGFIVAVLAISLPLTIGGCDVLDAEADGGAPCEGANCGAGGATGDDVDAGAGGEVEEGTGGAGGDVGEDPEGQGGAGDEVDEGTGGAGDVEEEVEVDEGTGGVGGDVEEEVEVDEGTGGTVDDPEGTDEVDGEDPVYAAYTWVALTDLSVVENASGTPGADVCGVVAECGDGEVVGLSAVVDPGAGEVCSEVDPPDCSAVRNDPAAALDEGLSCEAVSAPSDYVSMGVGGSLWVDLGQDLQGCTVTIVELQGHDDEPYEVRVCADDSYDDCLDDGSPLGLSSDSGGDVSVEVPSVE